MSSCIDFDAVRMRSSWRCWRASWITRNVIRRQKTVCKMLLVFWGNDPIWPIIYMSWNHHADIRMCIKLGCQGYFIFRCFSAWASWKFLSLSTVTGKGIIPTYVGDTPGHEEKNWKCLWIRRTGQWSWTLKNLPEKSCGVVLFALKLGHSSCWFCDQQLKQLHL